jgi:hypothetical protein
MIGVEQYLSSRTSQCPRLLERMGVNTAHLAVPDKVAMNAVQGLTVEVQVSDEAGVGVEKEEVACESAGKLAPASSSTASVRSPEEDDEFGSVAEEVGVVDCLVSEV